MVNFSTTVREGKKSGAEAAVKVYSQAEIANLVEKAAGGSFKAFGDLYGIFLSRIYRYIYYQIKDKMTAEDLTEEVFVKAWKAIGSCKGRGNTFSSWLYRIAHNHMASTIKTSKKFIPLDEVTFSDIRDPNQEVEINADCCELLENITCLPDKQKQVIILKFIEGLENREIAEIMKKKEGAIRILQMRALVTLRNNRG